MAEGSRADAIAAFHEENAEPRNNALGLDADRIGALAVPKRAECMSDAITLELPKQNVTVIGAFNPAIFEPPWVKRHVPAVEGDITVGLNVGSGPPICRAGELYWIVTNERLVVHGPTAQAGRMVSEILLTLPHTPLRAAGANFLFSGRADRDRFGPWRIGSSTAGVSDLLRGAPAELALSQVALREDGVQVTAKVVWPSESPEALLDLNYHLEASGWVPEERAKQLADHSLRAADLESDALRIRRELLGE